MLGLGLPGGPLPWASNVPIFPSGPIDVVGSDISLLFHGNPGTICKPVEVTVIAAKRRRYGIAPIGGSVIARTARQRLQR